MPAYKVTWFFESVQTSNLGTDSALGWTETWYTVDTLTDNLDQMVVRPEIEEWMRKRLGFMDFIYRIPFVRVSEVGAPGRVKILTKQGFVGKVDDAPTKGQVQCGILVDYQKLPALPNERVHHRRYIIRGINAGLINGNVINANHATITELKAFLDYTGRKPSGTIPDVVPPAPFWGIRYHDPAITKIPINSMHIVDDDPRRMRVGGNVPNWVAVANATLTNPPTRVKVFDVQAPYEKVNRDWLLLDRDLTDPNAVLMVFGTARRDLPLINKVSPLGLGYMLKEQWKYGPCDQYAIIGLRSKRTGRIFRQLRGRSRNR